MIRLLEGGGREIPLQSPLSLLCALDFAAYENRYPFSQVWEWKNQGMAGGCLCLFYSEATAWAGEETGAAEIAEYLSALSWDSLLCTGEIARHLQDIPGRRKPIWALGARDLPGRKEERAVHPSEAEVYELLSMSVRGTLPSFDGWYCDRNHRARRGLMET